jgi:exopolysaccharide production protein ExoQ
MHPPSKVEQVFAMIFLLLSTGAFMNLFLGRSFNATKGLPIMQEIWVVVYLVVLFFLFTECHGVWTLLLRGWPFLLLLAVVLLSGVWSDAKDLTVRRSFALLATTMAGLYLAIRYNFEQQIRLLMPVLKVCVLCSYIFGVLELGTSLDNLPNKPWYGIFTQRNGLGTIMALSTLVFLLWTQIEPEERWGSYCWTFFSFVLLLLSGSATGFLSMGAGMLLLVFLRQIRLSPENWRRIILLTVLAVGVALFYTVNHFGEVMGTFERDVTLTGRTTIWGASLILGMDRPWTGHGFDAFWLGDQGASGQIRKIAGWDVPGAHNGFLEIWLDLGLLGLALFFLGFVRHMWKAVRCFLRGGGWEEAWPILFLIFLFFVNLAQSLLLSPNSVYWILYAMISYRVCLMTAQQSQEGAE